VQLAFCQYTGWPDNIRDLPAMSISGEEIVELDIDCGLG
jgi:hypothetical protein